MTQATNYGGYEDFREKTNCLVSLIDQQIKISQALQNKQQEANLESMRRVVKASNFKVMVLGEFKRGKSTFINALLGDEILPAYSTPCTAIINEVKWSEKKRALLYFSKLKNEPQKSPIEVPIDEIEEYVVIKDDHNEGQAISESPYEKLELFWPLKLCENGVEIIDSPGLNEHKTRQQVTENYLTTVDAILLVLSCEQLFSQSEQDVVDNRLRPMGHDDIFFICNRINMIRKKEVEKIKQYAISKLASRTRLGAKRIFFINALGALDGKLDDDAEEVEKSGISYLEQELQKFLTQERGRVKILRPAQELKNSIREARQSIPEQRNLLQMSVSDLEKRYVAVQKPLDILESKRQNIVRKIENSANDIRGLVSHRVSSFCNKLVYNFTDIATEYDLQQNIQLIKVWNAQDSIKAAVKEVSEYLECWVESEFADWQKTELEPFLTQRIDALKHSLDSDASEFLQKIDYLRLKISGMPVQQVSIEGEDVGVRNVSAMERILSAAGGFLVGGFGSATVGATFGYQEMLKSLIPQIAIGFIGAFFLGLNPITLVPMIVAALVQGKLMEGKAANKIKSEVGKKFSEQIRRETSNITKKVEETVSAELEKLQNLVDEGLGVEINNIRQQVESAKAEKLKGQAEVNRKLQQLETLEKTVNKVDQDLDNLISQIAF